ncbi:D-amino acid dehydrogenase [Skeletonema marinoi]|uniref:D-amino acid dehydrogenase n=1 Tax=Skeletonema marinoi TaxID=267567 RepID=A0AAD8XRE9_9STRA|nr:D-amino acid dehydrogenase [Skeletonema marinoi]
MYLSSAASEAVASALHKIASRSLTSSSAATSQKKQHIIILGGGIAGLSTARYLLGHTQQHRNVNITLIDRNVVDNNNNTQPSSTYEEQQTEYPHFSTPSRRNGNVLCPSLTIPWTTRSLFNEAIKPAIKSVFAFNNNQADDRPAITFDWKSLMSDRSMYSFATHYLLQKTIYKPPKQHQCNKSILEYNMECLDDPCDALVQSIDYGRFAQGTQLVDGKMVEGDSSGDVGLFCRGLLRGLQCEFDDRFVVRSEESVDSLVLTEDHGNNDNGQQHQDSLSAVVTVDRNGIKSTIHADQFVIALGNESRPLCNKIQVPCPIYPVKGHLVTISSSVDCIYNITLPNGIGYAAPMDHKVNGRRLYRLSGFVDFTPNKEPDQHRIDALVNAAKIHLDDVEVIDASACHRPFSADDRPIIGPAAKFGNVYLCTGFGSRGWSVGLGSGSLLASLILGLPCNVDPEPYLPRRFGARYF